MQFLMMLYQFKPDYRKKIQQNNIANFSFTNFNFPIIQTPIEYLNLKKTPHI